MFGLRSDWRSKVVIKVVVFVVAVIVLSMGIVFYYLSGQLDNIPFALLKDIVFFFLSVFLSYSVAMVISRGEYKAELEKLGNISVRRMGRLSENIRQIAKSLQREGVQYADELFRVAKDADESMADILLITEVTENRSNSETIFCPHCGFKDTIVVPDSIGGSDKTTCRHCGRPFFLHRVQNGVKIVAAQLGVSAAKNGPSANKIEAKCPNMECSQTLFLPPHSGRKEVYCFDCHYRMDFDFDNKRVMNAAPANFISANQSFENVKLSGGMPCPKCGKSIPEGRFFIKNRSGEKFAKCLSCDSVVHTNEIAGMDDSITEAGVL